MYPNALHVPPDEVDAAPKPIQLAAGLGCATSWKLHDAGTFSLRWITRDADAVIDLLGGTRELAETVSDHPQLPGQRRELDSTDVLCAENVRAVELRTYPAPRSLRATRPHRQDERIPVLYIVLR